MIYYVCKYTPLELFAGFGAETRPLDEMPENFERADQAAPANLCGFGRSVVELVERGGIDELVLTNCCDVMRRVYDILKQRGKLKFLYLLDFPREAEECGKENFARNLLRQKEAYAAYSGRSFDPERFAAAFHREEAPAEPYVGVLGVRMGPELLELVRSSMKIRVQNLTCLGTRNLTPDIALLREEAREMKREGDSPQASERKLFYEYASALLSQTPCRRMISHAGRDRLFLDENLKGILYHTIKFCDYYGFEYAEIKNRVSVPLLKIETDYTRQSAGQLRTRIEAFAETIGSSGEREEQKLTERERKMIAEKTYYTAGIDSGSTSTDVVILDSGRNIVSSIIIPTGGGASVSAEKSLGMALEKAGISREEVLRIVTTGYGRENISEGEGSVTEITCHAKGAHFLHPEVRTIIDIGGQDSKAIRVDETGQVRNFLMNDKCAAGTGRFLEMMARTLEIPLEEMSTLGLSWKKNVTISSMCTVFAESEVVSLVAENQALPDIIHGLNRSIASRVGALAKRLDTKGAAESPYADIDFTKLTEGKRKELRKKASCMMTGGVAKNEGIVEALEETMRSPIYICEESQICGAIGAALFALEYLEGRE